MAELEKALAIIAAASGADTTAVAERIQSDDVAADIASELFEPRFKAQRDQGDQRATMKTRKEVEKAFKAAGVTDASFAELPAAIEALQQQAATATGATLTEEQVLKHPAAVKALNTLRQSQQQAIDAARAEERQALADKEAKFTKAQTDAAVRKEAERLVGELNPNFSPDPARAARQRQKLIDDLVAEGGYQVGENGAINLVDADGNLLPGKLGTPAQFADRLRERADEFYGLPAATPRTSPGLTAEQAASAAAADAKKYQGDLPKTAAEYAALLPTLTPEQQAEVGEWRKATKPF